MPPIVVAGSTGDPIVPLAWSERLAAYLGGAFVTRDGVGHEVFNTCTNDIFEHLLLGLETPPPGTVCTD